MPQTWSSVCPCRENNSCWGCCWVSGKALYNEMGIYWMLWKFIHWLGGRLGPGVCVLIGLDRGPPGWMLGLQREEQFSAGTCNKMSLSLILSSSFVFLLPPAHSHLSVSFLCCRGSCCLCRLCQKEFESLVTWFKPHSAISFGGKHLVRHESWIQLTQHYIRC